jgi:hypothetical protein
MISSILLFSSLFSTNISLADKPYEEWCREDVIQYLESNNIIFEGEYVNASSDQNIIVGRLNSEFQTININFYITEGKLDKALLTTTESGTFKSLQSSVEHEGFEEVSESFDQLGNQYKKYHAGSVELTVVNKNADWPEMYFQP